MPETVTLIIALKIAILSLSLHLFTKHSKWMIDTQTPDFFTQIDVTGCEPLEPMDEPGPNSIPNNDVLGIATVCYTEITDLRIRVEYSTKP